MPNVLSGTVRDIGEGFIVLGVDTRIVVSSRLRPDGLARGVRVIVSVRLRGAEWVAEDVKLAG